MTVYNVVVPVALNVEADTAGAAERAADAYVAERTSGSVVSRGIDMSTFEAVRGTEPDLRAEGTS